MPPRYGVLMPLPFPLPLPLTSVRTRKISGTVLTVTLIAAACSGGDDGEPPPVTRETFPPTIAASGGSFDDDATTDANGSDGEGGRDERDADSGTAGADGSAASSSGGGADDTSGGERSYSITWEDRGNGVESGFLTVPREYGDPGGDTIDLFVVRHRASDDKRVGVLFSNNGGPGFAASGMAGSVRGWFMDPLIERFDIVSWDPRGTGQSGGAADCIEGSEYDRYFASSDVTPEDGAERADLINLSKEFADACIAAVGDVLPHIGTNNSARDIDAIRQALGEPQASYLGYSYGSELGAVWATLFPDTVRAAVLDGAAHPDAEGIEPVRLQRLGFERVLNDFLAQCSADDGCPFHNDGDAEGAYDALMAAVDENPVPTTAGRPPVNLEVAINGVVQAMYSERRWEALARALNDAANGDGNGLLALHDSYMQRDPQTGGYPDVLESFQAISCADDPERLDPDAADARAEPLIGIAPRLFPYTTGSYTCGFFPPAADPRAEITGERAGPIMVIGTTGDPSTPLDSSRAMADALEEGFLVTVDAKVHTAYRRTDCVNDIVHDYLIWLEVPPADTFCD